ncbi:MAG: carbohydrate ABC transporter permease [Lachnospiraceae bacterium]|nr:carbohydrate ABC transporter permease [Lachnospiraceae bacterium]
MAKKQRVGDKISSLNVFLGILMTLISVIYVIPIVLVVVNSFKSKVYINDKEHFFKLPTEESYIGFQNYLEGAEKIDIAHSFLNTVIITIGSVAAIVLFCSMTAWYISRVKNYFTHFLYMLFAISMIVPFQMVMYPLSKVADELNLNNPVSIILVYLGFGAGLAVFMFAGFVKSIPLEIEEAAMIDGCSPIATFFRVVLPIMKPTAITVSILQAMWIWNDYLLPYLVLKKDYKTIPIAIQYLKGGFGSVEWGHMMAMLTVSIIPIIVFYIVCQKYIIKGVVAGAVKG